MTFTNLYDSPVELLAVLREQVSSVTAALERHEALASRRDIHLPVGALMELTTLRDELERLAGEIDEQEQEVGQLRSLAQTSALVNSSLDIDVVLAQAMDELIALTGAERGFILLVDPTTNKLEFRISRGVDPKQLGGGDEVSRTILRDVLQTAKSILTDNAMEDVRLAESETVAKFVLRSIMCVPLVVRNRSGAKERVSGAIYVDNKFREAVFSALELNLLESFANQAAVAIDNAMLYRQVQTTLADITRARAIIENVFASIDSGVITTNPKGDVTLLNRAASEILRTTAESALSRPLAALLHGLPDEAALNLTTAPQSERAGMLEIQPEVPGRGRIVLNVRVSSLKSTDGSHLGAAMVFDDLTDERARDETLSMITRYLPPGMLENIHQIADLAMGGERREVTCVFMSACQFSDFPPGLRPHQIMERLNIFLQAATQVIHRSQGIVDKYLGNEIMILFNTQLNPDIHHARRAVEMALALRDTFDDLSEQHDLPPDRPQYTIGVHTGMATLGNVGNLRRRSFTSIGDTINLAKRIQEMAVPGEILVTGDTIRAIESMGMASAHMRFTPKSTLQVRGRHGQTEIFEASYA